MSTREQIKSLQKEVLQGNLHIVRVGEIATQLSSLLSTVNEKLVESEMFYNEKLANILEGQNSVNKATVMSKTTPEYRLWQEMLHLSKSTSKTITTLNNQGHIMREEQRVGKY